MSPKSFVLSEQKLARQAQDLADNQILRDLLSRAFNEVAWQIGGTSDVNVKLAAAPTLAGARMLIETFLTLGDQPQPRSKQKAENLEDTNVTYRNRTGPGSPTSKPAA